MPELILASTSRYRQALLGRLGLPFRCEAPGTDEARRPGEEPAALATRLAQAKAQAIAQRHPGAVVIGSDQVASLAGEVLGKPGDPEHAAAQLRRQSGRTVVFLTAVCVVDAAGRPAQACDETRVRFRTLDEATIAHYLAAEAPFDCAGSFKSEGLGISLFEAIETRDPTALVGLPLIATAGLLRAAGFRLP